MKEQQNSPEEELDKTEASNLSDTEFRVMIIRILKSMKKDIETIKQDQSEIKNAISEINNRLEGINSRLGEAEIKSMIQKTRQEKKSCSGAKIKKIILKNEENLRNILDNMKHNNIHIMGISEGEESKQETCLIS